MRPFIQDWFSGHTCRSLSGELVLYPTPPPEEEGGPEIMQLEFGEFLSSLMCKITVEKEVRVNRVVEASWYFGIAT